MNCKDCKDTYKVQRKHGVTTHCNLEPTHMDVSYYCLPGHSGSSAFCPKKKHIKDSTELSGGHLW